MILARLLDDFLVEYNDAVVFAADGSMVEDKADIGVFPP